MLFNSSKLKHPHAPLSISQATMSFSDWVRNLGFYLEKDFPVKEHDHFICKTAFLGMLRISTVRYNFTNDATSVLGRQTSESRKLCSLSCRPCTSTRSHHSNTQTSQLVACQCSYFPWDCVPLFNGVSSSTPAYRCDLLHLYSPSRSLLSSADTRLFQIHTRLLFTDRTWYYFCL